MLLHSLQTFHEREDVAMVVVVLPHEHVGDPPPWLFRTTPSACFFRSVDANAAIRFAAASRISLKTSRLS